MGMSMALIMSEIEMKRIGDGFMPQLKQSGHCELTVYGDSNQDLHLIVVVDICSLSGSDGA